MGTNIDSRARFSKNILISFSCLLSLGAGFGVALLPLRSALVAMSVIVAGILAVTNPVLIFVSGLFSRSILDGLNVYLVIEGVANIRLTAVVAILILVAAGSYLFRVKSKAWQLPVSLSYFVFLIWALLSTTWASSRTAAIQDWGRLASIISVFLLSVEVAKTQEGERLLRRTVLLSALIPMIYGTYQFLFRGGRVVPGGYRRYASTFSSENQYAIFLLLIATISLSFYLAGNGERKSTRYLVLSGLLFASIVPTLSRIAYIGFILVILIAVLKDKRVAFLLVLILPFAFVMAPEITVRISELRLHDPRMNNLLGRYLLWREQLGWFLKSPLWGHGLGYYSSYELRHLLPHNLYVALVVELGMIGLLLYLLPMGLMLVTTIRNYNVVPTTAEPALLALLMSTSVYLMASFTENMFTATSFLWPYWVVAGIAQRHIIDRLSYNNRRMIE